MGADIHMYAEKKIDDEWKLTKGPNPYKIYFPSDEDLKFEGWVYHQRDYDLFAFLADVRNYDESIDPLDQPRGMPEDTSPMLFKLYEEYGVDGHSHSYFSLPELLAADQEFAYLKLDAFTKKGSAIRKLEDLAQGDPDSVRIVFWFDN